jgi:CheY-like chemotaxis protein
MSTCGNLLIVEDDAEWCEAYSRAAAREKVSTVKIANTLAEAEAFIDDFQFAVAFIDVGLNVSDDQNVDGVRVMDRIRTVGDQTSIVVVTGRSGRDVIPITKDAIRKYRAYDVIQKVEIEPRAITKLIHSGILAFEENSAGARGAPADVLRGRTESWAWDYQILHATGASDGVRGLYGFLSKLLGPFLPLVASVEQDAVQIDEDTGLIYGNFWSRCVGQAIALCFGAEQAAEAEIGKAEAEGALLGRYHVDEMLARPSECGLSGAVFALRDASRDSYVRL